MKNTILATSLAIMLIAGVSTDASAALVSNAILNIGPQTTRCYLDIGVPGACAVAEIPDANYWALGDSSNGGTDEVIDDFDLIAIEAGTDGGIVMGSVQGVGDIDAEWEWYGTLGSHTQAGTLSIASDDGAGNATLDMTGWDIFWNDGYVNLHQYGGSNLIADITCGNTCENGDTYILNYDSQKYIGPPGFGYYIPYTFHISGTISAVPVPAAIWLFGSGLIGLVGLARSKKA